MKRAAKRAEKFGTEVNAASVEVQWERWNQRKLAKRKRRDPASSSTDGAQGTQQEDQPQDMPQEQDADTNIVPL